MRQPRAARKICLALAVAGTAGLGALFPGEVRSEDKATTTIEVAVEGADLQTAITVKGDCQLPDGAKVVVVLLHKDAKFDERLVTVGASRYLAKFGPWKKVLFPGTYEAQLVFTPNVQKQELKKMFEGLKPSKDKAPFSVGNAADVAYNEHSVKAKMLDVIENIRLGYLELSQAGTYYQAELQLMVLEVQAKLPEKQHQEHQAHYFKRRAELFNAWQEISRANWDERFKTTKYDWKTFRDQVVVSPFPGAEDKIQELFKVYELWYRGMSNHIYKLCEKPLPEELQGPVDTDPLKMQGQIEATAQACYTALGYPTMPQWSLSDLTRPERGKILPDGTVRTYISKFEIKRPSDPSDWVYFPGGNKPAIRLTFKPPEVKDAKLASTTVVAVEILDYAVAESMKHLAQLAREMNRTRWRGGKELKSENINASDPTMPGGTRPGVDSEFLIEDGKLKLHCRYYQLFCRWHKRTYGVLCLCPDEDWASREETFRKACASFKVLDSPAFKDLKEDEMRKQLVEEGAKDPQKALDDANKFLNPDGKTDKPKDPPK